MSYWILIARNDAKNVVGFINLYVTCADDRVALIIDNKSQHESCNHVDIVGHRINQKFSKCYGWP